jgi:hypothetical protein
MEACNNMGMYQILHSRKQQFSNARNLIFYICMKESRQNASKVAVLIWSIWQDRNNYVWNKSKLSAQQVGMQAAQIWQDWAMMQGFIYSASLANNHLPGVDSSFYDIAGATGWGWCLRDHLGRFKLAGTNLMYAY